VANGLRTDHPIPDLPLVDDAHLPLEDPQELEAVGRHPGTDTWGRYDPVFDGEVDTGWIAFTTAPGRHELGWVVRFHPEHGRSVILYRDEDVASAHTQFTGQPDAQQRRRGDEEDRPPLARQNPRQTGQDESVAGGEPRTRHLPSQDRDLLAQDRKAPRWPSFSCEARAAHCQIAVIESPPMTSVAHAVCGRRTA
jgi:hypothetical protein